MTMLSCVGGGPRDVDAVRTGKELADAFDENLRVLHVQSEDRFRARREDRADYYQDDAAADAAAFARERSEEALGVDDLRTVTGIEPAGTVGDPATKILEAATHHDAKYVVVGGRKRTPVGKAIFGSVTQSVLLDADRPVVTVTGPGQGDSSDGSEVRSS